MALTGSPERTVSAWQPFFRGTFPLPEKPVAPLCDQIEKMHIQGARVAGIPKILHESAKILPG
jgi:hypothetical protein